MRLLSCSQNRSSPSPTDGEHFSTGCLYCRRFQTEALMLSSRGDSKNLPTGENQGAMPKKAGGGTPRITIKHGANASEVASIAARELADGLAKMFAGEATPQPAAEID